MKKNYPTKEEIIHILRINFPKFRELGVMRLGLFGSYVRGEQCPDSDIDILVEFEPGKKNYDNFIELNFLLEDITQKPIELVTPESLSKYLRPHILKEVEYVKRAA